jgi:hypothetical protein
VLSPPNDRSLVLALVGVLVLGFATGTEYVAWGLGFPSALGVPIFVLSRHALLLARVSTIASAGGGVTLILFARARRWSGALLVMAAGSAMRSLGPTYSPHMIAVWQGRYVRIEVLLPTSAPDG